MMLWMWIWCVLEKLCCLKMILMSTLQIFSDQKKVVSKTASKKMTPVKKAPASNRVKVASIKPIHPIKSQSLSKEDIVKLVGELFRKEFAKLGVHLPDDEDGNKETVDQEDANQEDDAMDIDLVRLENAKDLLAMEGRVKGTAVQILADTCANLSWIPKSLAEELGMKIDISRTVGRKREFWDSTPQLAALLCSPN